MEILQQNLEEHTEDSGLYMMYLLFDSPVKIPKPEKIQKALEEHMESQVDIVSGNEEMMSFAVYKYQSTYADDVQVPAQVTLLKTPPSSLREELSDVDLSQQWDCENWDELLENTTNTVALTDFIARGLPYKERGSMMYEWLVCALELFPTATGVLFLPSRKFLTKEAVQNNPYSDDLAFLYGGLNVRFFNITDTEDMMVDTLGFHALGMPDIQIHFKGLNPDEIIPYAFNIAAYQYLNGFAVENGDTIAGTIPDVNWICEYEDALIQPLRQVLDIHTGKFAAGNRGE